MLQRLGFEICSGGIIGMGESKEDIVDMLLDLREIQPEALPINFLLPIPGTPLENADTSVLTPSYCMKVLCLARLMVPQSDIRCAAGREVYFKGREKELLSIVDSIFASGYLTADGQGISDTIKTITDAGFTYEIESDLILIFAAGQNRRPQGIKYPIFISLSSVYLACFVQIAGFKYFFRYFPV